MEPGPQVLVAYGWNRLLRDIVAVALSKYGWRVVGAQTQQSESDDVDLVLVYGSSSITAMMDHVQRAHAEHPAAKVILLGGIIADAELLQFIEAGIGGYVKTHQGLPEMLNIMQMVRENRSLSEGRITQLVLESIGRRSGLTVANANAQLTLREQEVLYLITTGIGNKEIAVCLSISPNTVKNHVHNVLQKLNVRSRQEAASIEPSLGDLTERLAAFGMPPSYKGLRKHRQ